MPDATTETEPVEELIGPLTAQEWASFRVHSSDQPEDADDPLPPCCGDIADLREAVFATLRIGADREDASYPLRDTWNIVQGHEGLLQLPVWQKLYAYYVEDRDPLPDSDAIARTMATNPELVSELIAAAHKIADIRDDDENTYVLGKLVRFVAFIYDPHEREKAIITTADTLGRLPADVRLVTNATRAIHNLPPHQWFNVHSSGQPS